MSSPSSLNDSWTSWQILWKSERHFRLCRLGTSYTPAMNNKNKLPLESALLLYYIHLGTLARVSSRYGRTGSWSWPEQRTGGLEMGTCHDTGRRPSHVPAGCTLHGSVCRNVWWRLSRWWLCSCQQRWHNNKCPGCCEYACLCCTCFTLKLQATEMWCHVVL